MADFLMPALGADMESAKVAQWLVQPGGRVKPGDVVVVVETHKGAIDVEIFQDGVLQDLAPEGTALPVGGVLARVTETSTAAAAPSPAPVEAAVSAVASPIAAPAPPPAPATPMPATQAALAATTAATGTRIKASPAARQLAGELKLPLESITGTGTGMDGSIVRADVERAAARAPATAATPAAPASAAASPRAPKAGFDPALMRQAIAAAMGRSKREIPHYYLSSTIDFETAHRWLEAHNRDKPPPERLMPATLLIKACALALKEVPQLNGFYENEAFRPGAGIHLGWAIALRGGGLVAPAIHDADQKTLPELMQALRDLVQRARTGGLRSSELSDPTVTVTSLGDRGADAVLGVIYPPQVAIVGFGRLLQRPWVVEGQVLPRHLLSVSLAADHRASDGHLGGQLLAAIDKALQNPEQL